MSTDPKGTGAIGIVAALALAFLMAFVVAVIWGFFAVLAWLLTG